MIIYPPRSFVPKMFPHLFVQMRGPVFLGQYEAEMETLHVQMEEARQQTEHLEKQTRYLFWGVVFTAVTSLMGIIVQISPNLWGLLGE